MTDHWTPALSEEGSKEVFAEQQSREAETPQRRAMLERVRAAIRALGRQDTERRASSVR